jgi:malate dehydrogenase
MRRRPKARSVRGINVPECRADEEDARLFSRAPVAASQALIYCPGVQAARGSAAISLRRRRTPKNMARKKIALIGAGNIGGELARLCLDKQLGDIVLFDIPAKEDFAKGKALDLEQASSLSGNDATIIGTSRWEDCAGADVLIITAGIPRKPGQSRDDLVATNLPIIQNVADNAKKHCPNAFVIVISNPLDAMVYEFRRRTGKPRSEVVGMAGALDSARFQLFLARAAGVSVKDVRAGVLGGHGDDMVPVLSNCTINGIPAQELVAKDVLEGIVERTRKGGGEIVGLMGTSAYFAPAAGAVTMAESYLLDQKRLLPCAAYLEGEFGYRDLYLGVPVVIGATGVEKIIEIKLNDDEKAMLAKSAESVQKIVDVVKKSAG